MIAGAGLLTVAILVVGYVALGWWLMLLFAFGFVGGFFLWLLFPAAVSFRAIRGPYFAALGLFVVHKWEERHFDFFPALARLTGVPPPESGSALAVLLYAFAGAWLLVPLLVGRANPFGYYLARTLFTSMGVTELAHFVFPFFTAGPYSYFPGMGSVVGLAPVAWWGIWRLRGHFAP